MKTSKLILFAGLLAATLLGSSCGDEKAKYLKEIPQTNEQLTLWLNKTQISASLLSSIDVNYTEGQPVEIKMDVAGNSLQPTMLRPETFNYLAAVVLAANKGPELDKFIETYTGADVPLAFTLYAGSQKSETFKLSGREMSKLLKTPFSEMQPGKVKSQVCTMFDELKNPIVQNIAKVPDATLDPVEISSGVFKFSISFPNASSYAKLKLPNLKMRAMRYFNRYFATWGDLEYPLFQMFESLKVEGVIVEFKAANSDRVLSTTLKWDNLLEELPEETPEN